MLQLNKSQEINTIAFYPNELTTGSAIILDYTQSYSNTVTGSIEAEIISDPQTTPWIIAQFSGSLLPSASGQYDFKIYELTSTGSLVWDLVNTQWNLELATWNSTGSSLVLGDLISQERAIISGSDVTPITEYVSSNENARYTVYLG